MRDASRVLKLISFIWLSFPLTYVALTASALDLDLSDVFKIVLTPGYWLVSFFAILAGFGLLKIRWYGWYAFLLSNLTIAWQNAVVLVFYSDRHQKILTFVISFVVQLVLIWIAGKEIRVPYFFPRIRWWENDPRYKLSIATKILRTNNRPVEEADIMDISLGGCFIKTATDYDSDENVDLEFVLFDRPIRCQGRVMWRTESAVTHPKGIGVKFDGLDRETTAVIKRATRKLKKLSKMYTQITREKNWREFQEREKKKNQS